MVWRCQECHTIMVEHYCGPCNVLNPDGILIYCPQCEKHPTELYQE